MNIVADQQIPLVADAFAQFGTVKRLPGREIRREHLTDCDVLLVRSVTRINADLLAKTPVQFIATATSGFDHIDRGFLQANNIGFSYAPGCNARPVAEYVLAAVLQLEPDFITNASEKTLGIIGYGHVGTKVARFFQAIGVECVINDPPLAEKNPTAEHFQSLDAALQCDVITLHVPLEREGRYATENLLAADRLQQIRAGSILINTARGEVLNQVALKQRLQKQDIRTVIDVWQNEPAIDIELLAQVEIGTPHIAGYSLDGRYRSAEKIYLDCCDRFNTTPTYDFPALPVTERDAGSIGENELLPYLIRQSTPIQRDAADLSRIIALPEPGERASEFDRLRREYPTRREFSSTRVNSTGLTGTLQQTLQTLGFQA